MTCPFVNECEREVDYEYYRDYCSGGVYYYSLCSKYRELAKRRMKPKEWIEKLRWSV